MAGFDATPSVVGNRLSMEVSYRADYSPNVMNMIGPETVSISDSQRATVSSASYININLLFDVSGSMGIGSTPADQQLIADTTNCAFACHTGSSRGNSTYDRARAAGAVIRIYTARTSAIDAVLAMETSMTLEDQVTVGLYKFSNEPTEILSPSDARASDLATVRNLISSEVQMDIEGTGTNIELAMRNMLAVLPTSGTGRTPDDRVQYVVGLTDGVENTQSWYPGRGWRAHNAATVNSPSMRHAGHEINYAPATSQCDALKANGAQIYFINTEYIVPTTGRISSHNVRRFGFIEDTLHDLVDVRMKACAGRDANVVRTNTPEEIATAFNDVLGDISTPLRLY